MSAPAPSADRANPLADERHAPWFYRNRFAVFGLAYGLAFFFGFGIAGIAGIAPVPCYRLLGSPAAGASLAVLFVVAGFALRVWASSYLSASVVWEADPQSPELRVSGPYRFTRNPLYLGNELQAIGIGLVGPWPVFVLVTLAITIFNFALISVEEPFLSAKLGAAYARYRATVPRLIPIPGKAAPPGGQAASLGDGLRAEAVIGALALLIFALLFANTIWLARAGR